MPTDTHATLPLPGRSPGECKPIIARFDGGSLSSDGGLLALREIEECLGIAQRLAACIDDDHRQTARLNARSAAIASIMRASAGAVVSHAAACRCNSAGNDVTRGQGRSEIPTPQPLISASALSIASRFISCPPQLLLAARGLDITASARVPPPGEIRGAERGERCTREC